MLEEVSVVNHWINQMTEICKIITTVSGSSSIGTSWMCTRCNIDTDKYRSSHSEVFLEKDVLKIWSKFTGEHLYLLVIYV